MPAHTRAWALNGGLSFQNSGLLAVACAAVGIVAVGLRARWRTGRLARSRQPGSAGGRESAVRPAGAVARWLAGPAVLLGVAAAARAFAPQGSDRLGVALAGLFLAAAGWVSVLSYRRRPADISRLRAAGCVAARLAAWLAVLVLIARPAWRWTVVFWEKPLLLVLLDASRSMAIADVPEQAAASGPVAALSLRSRAEVANEALAAASPALQRLGERYELRLLGIGSGAVPLERCRVEPQFGSTALAAALRGAAAARSTHGEPPAAVVLVSDGAENVAGAAEVLQAAAALDERGIALLALGAGPDAESMPAVYIEPPRVPARVSLRQRVAVPVAARIMGCAGRVVRIEVRWGDSLLLARDVHVGAVEQRFEDTLTVHPPARGVHRLTIRAALPQELGGAVFAQSQLVEVSDDHVRTVYAFGRLHTEVGFVSRALRGDPSIELSQRFVSAAEVGGAEAGDASGLSEGADVVILGAGLERVLTAGVQAALRDAVLTRGVGVLLAGGRDLFLGGTLTRGPLNELLPVRSIGPAPQEAGSLELRWTDAGRAHPVLRGWRADGGPSTLATAEPAYRPALPIAVRFGGLAPLAVVLAEAPEGRPVLVAQEIGAGRCMAAAWEATWPWALASDAGFEDQQRFWRQAVHWLANRRPAAWVATPADEYVLGAVRAGDARIEVRAGLSGGAGMTQPLRVRDPQLRVRRVAAGVDARLLPADVPAPAEHSTVPAGSRPADTDVPGERWLRLEPRGSEWLAVLPQTGAGLEYLEAGQYELEFSVRLAEDGGGRPVGERAQEELLTARSRFRVVDVDVERLPPSANLELLRQCAARTSRHGGRYANIREAPRVLEELSARDGRRRIEREEMFDPLRRAPWMLLAILVAALSVEWLLRRRAGVV